MSDADTRDRLAIQELLHRYALTMDLDDADGTAGCFTEDAVYELHGTDTLKGRDEIRALFADMVTTVKRICGLDDLVSSTHAMSNIQIELDGDAARSSSMVLAHITGSRGGQPLTLIRCVRYADRLERTVDGWLIARRRHVLIWVDETRSTMALPTHELRALLEY